MGRGTAVLSETRHARTLTPRATKWRQTHRSGKSFISNPVGSAAYLFFITIINYRQGKGTQTPSLPLSLSHVVK